MPILRGTPAVIRPAKNGGRPEEGESGGERRRRLPAFAEMTSVEDIAIRRP